MSLSVEPADDGAQIVEAESLKDELGARRARRPPVERGETARERLPAEPVAAALIPDQVAVAARAGFYAGSIAGERNRAGAGEQRDAWPTSQRAVERNGSVVR